MNIDKGEKFLPNNIEFCKAVGRFLHVARIIRQDISTVVNIICSKKEIKLMINKENDPVLTVYTDTDWVNDKFERKSKRRNSCKLEEPPISFISKQQKTHSHVIRRSRVCVYSKCCSRNSNESSIY